MKLQYFRRNSKKENFSNENTMLLLSKLCSYSQEKFQILLSKILPENTDIELTFSMPVASNEKNYMLSSISQDSFIIAIETKPFDQFDIEHLLGHLNSFQNKNHGVLVTLDSQPFPKNVSDRLEVNIQEMHQNIKSIIIHRHFAFDELINLIAEVLDEKDEYMIGVLEDYKEYCYKSALISDEYTNSGLARKASSIFAKKNLDSFYGNNDKSNKSTLIIGVIIICVAIVFSYLYTCTSHVTRVAFLYLATLATTESLLFFSWYFFSKKKNSGRFKTVKYLALRITLAVFMFLLCPIYIIVLVADKAKIHYLYQHFIMYVLTISVSFLCALITLVISFALLNKIPGLNAYTASALIAFLTWVLGEQFFLFVFNKNRKNRHNDIVYISIQKDLYILVFLFIAFVTLIANTIKFCNTSMVDGLTSAFAIYIACDRLYSKWDKLNNDLEKKINK
jgi:hypothetical protein